MPGNFRRDGVTWTGYGLIGVWAFFLYLVGPASGAIAGDLGLSDAAEGFFGTALAVGLIGAAVAGPWAVRRWGRAGAIQRILLGLAALGLIWAAGRNYPMILLTLLGLGLLGAVLANTTTAVLSDHHPRDRARAITEGNAVAAWLGFVAPAALGVFLATPLGWRGAALLVALLPLLALLPARVLRRAETRDTAETPARPGTPGPDGTTDGQGTGSATRERGPMPAAFWLSLVAIGAAVAVEFSVNFWGANLIAQQTGATTAAAVSALSAAVGGVALGRTVAAGLPDRFPLPRLITLFFLLAAVGIAALLAATSYWVAVGALFITGLGISVLFPFTQSMALHTVPGQADRAVALAGLAIGVAIGSAPFALGLLAGAVGLQWALSITFMVVAAGIAATALVARSGPS